MLTCYCGSFLKPLSRNNETKMTKLICLSDVHSAPNAIPKFEATVFDPDEVIFLSHFRSED